MIDIIRNNRNEIEAFCKEFGVSRLSVFGSAARGDFDPASSDLDFLVEFATYGEGVTGKYFGLVRSLESCFGRKVDLVFGPTVKNPILQEEIDRTLELIYESPSRKVAA